MRTADKVVLNCCDAFCIGRSITDARLVEDAAVVISNFPGIESNDVGTRMVCLGYFAARAPQ